MSEAPDLTEAEAFAAEHALGVLDARERAEAENRMAREPAFAADVEAWRMRLAPMLDAVEPVPAPQGVWPRIEAQLPAIPANDNSAVMNRLRFWRNSAMGGFALAAASLAGVMVQISQPPVVVEKNVPVAPQGQMLNASLTATSGAPQPLFVAAYDPDRKALIITSLLPEKANRDKVHQLWLIAGQDKPKSLGLLNPARPRSSPCRPRPWPRWRRAPRWPFSLEPPGGSKSPDGPSDPGRLEWASWKL